MGLPMALLAIYCLSIYLLLLFSWTAPGIANRANLPQGENIEYRMMPPRTECDSTFPSSLKEISGINDRPPLRTDQKHARQLCVQLFPAPRGEYRISNDAPTDGMRFNILVFSERNLRDKWSPPSLHWPKTRPDQNSAGRCGPIEHVCTPETTEKTRMFHLTASPPLHPLVLGETNYVTQSFRPHSSWPLRGSE